MPEGPIYEPRKPEPPSIKVPAKVDCAYAELEVSSNFSFLRGASHPDELINRAAELGYRAIAFTDRNSLAGVVRAHIAAKEVGIHLIIGSRLILEDGPECLVWVMNRTGYAHLCRLLTTGKRRAAKGECLLTIDDLLQHSQGLHAGVIADSLSGESIHPLREGFGDRLSLVVRAAYGGKDKGNLSAAHSLSRAYGIPLLASNDVHYHDASRRPLQDALTCVRHGCTIQEAGLKLFPNGERYLKPPDVMHHLFRDYPLAIRRGIEVAGQCTFSLSELRYEYPHELAPDGTTAGEYLRTLTEEGVQTRFPQGVPEKVRRQIEHELQLIGQLKFEAYFLTVHDLVRFARSKDILCQGRGSAANSAVCYCLGVTSVDPSRVNLLFERFVSAARNEPPDIDIDFAHERREEVLQYIYEKYGRERSGMTAEVISYRGRSALRDIGKAMGMNLDMINEVAKKLDWWDHGKLSDDRIRECGLDPADPMLRRIVGLSTELSGFPRHLGQHVGGMVMTQTPLCEIVPIENAAMEDRTVIEWDKNDIDALNILKVDCLGLGMLTCIDKAIKLLNVERSAQGSESRGIESLGIEPLEMYSIPAEDAATYEMICHADTLGVFQIESRAQMAMLPRLKPRTFYDLVIEVAIVRPGPIQGGMVHPYLRRRNGEEPVTFPSEVLREVLGRTLGVPLFQEQAMKMAMVAAGFTAEEADQLRRAMAAWRRSDKIHQFHTKIVQGMLRNGYEAEFAEQCFRQIQGFGEYGFPESHAASFALLVYVSCWLKRHHPAIFATALLNSQPMGFYAPAQIVRDAQEHGVEVRRVDINHSQWDCTLEAKPLSEPIMPDHQPHTWGVKGRAMRLGMRMIKGLSQTVADRIATARGENPFISVEDLQIRAGLSKAIITRLSEADALDSIDLSRRKALWETLALDDDDAPLFNTKRLIDPVVELPVVDLPIMPIGQEVALDYRTTGLSLKRHPVALVRERLDELRIMPASHIPSLRQGDRAQVAGLVLVRQKPGTSKVVFITLEDETGITNLIVQPRIFQLYRQIARHAGLLHARGYIERQGEVIHLLVTQLKDLSGMLEGVQFRSRDFH